MKSLQGVVMELDDCAFPLLAGIEPTSDMKTAFDGTSWALLVGSIPRKAGMERNDLLNINGGIFGPRAKPSAPTPPSDVRVLVVGNPCNTNCLIARAHAPEVPDERWFAMTRLDQNRAASQLAQQGGRAGGRRSPTWPSGATTRRPSSPTSRTPASTAGRPPRSSTSAWLEGEFITTVQQRGAADHRGPGRVVGGVGGQRRRRLGPQHRHAHGRRRLRLAGRRLPRRVRHARGARLRFPRRERRDGLAGGGPDSTTAPSPRERIRLTTEELESERAAVADLLLGPV